ncbi:MAG TPA: CehA/McbA family metallohydrolase, partial [Cyclobacteriaceae bacterium]|nr:CehA/McbA family metallohydrolase [Cyclobacteriaceae bacterium]
FSFCLISYLSMAQREAVLKQIDVPHDYYFREMYLPQLTTGPSSVTWSPGGEEVIYSMAGSLWRQKLTEAIATQLTDGDGYDYQPDWSPNGNEVIFTRYTGDALELQLLDLATGKVKALTTNGAVNLDPRFAPDGKTIAYVTTQNTGHFRIWTGKIENSVLGAKPLSPERKSQPRYYYSEYDHQLSPAWSPDGAELAMVSNPDQIYGTGSIYKVDIDEPGKLILIQKEETAWRTHPEWSPDGHRIVYGSFVGRQWHQLWATTSKGGGDPFALTFGKFDATNPRWSPNGKHIAYISNEGGNTELWTFELLSGKKKKIEIKERRYLNPHRNISIKVVDANGELIAGRISVKAANGKSYAPFDTWIHGDDAFNRAKQKYETYYFHTEGESNVTIPQGDITVTVWRGLEYTVKKQTVGVTADPTSLTIKMERLSFPPEWRNWVSADVHVHMNYGGLYRNGPKKMLEQARAEDLDIVFNTIVNKEVRIPDIDYFSVNPDPASTDDALLIHSQEHHTSYWGHMGLLGLKDHYIMPGYTTYPNTAISSPHPSNSVVADLAHQQGALVGYVHPFYEIPDPAKDDIHNALPVDVATGKIDYYETVGFSYHLPSAEVWHRLLNCGFRISAAGGTDAMSNYASLRGPVGMDRTYVQINGTTSSPSQKRDAWLAGLKAGNALATNSAILHFEVNGQKPGSEVTVAGKKIKLNYKGFMRSIIPMDHLEIIQNGKVVKDIKLSGDKTTADLEGTLTLDQSGWLLLRAWNDTDHELIQDFYPYATTNPVYVIKDSMSIRSPQDADYFIRWIDKIYESASRQNYFTEAEKELTLKHILTAKSVFESRK